MSWFVFGHAGCDQCLSVFISHVHVYVFGDVIISVEGQLSMKLHGKKTVSDEIVNAKMLNSDLAC